VDTVIDEPPFDMRTGRHRETDGIFDQVWAVRPTVSGLRGTRRSVWASRRVSSTHLGPSRRSADRQHVHRDRV